MSEDRNESSMAATGIGAVLAGVLSMFARSADDVARFGTHCVDDVGRACVTKTDDIGSVLVRGGDDSLHPFAELQGAHYVDDLRFERAAPNHAWQESDDGLHLSAHVTKEIAEGAIKLVDLNEGEDN